VARLAPVDWETRQTASQVAEAVVLLVAANMVAGLAAERWSMALWVLEVGGQEVVAAAAHTVRYLPRLWTKLWLLAGMAR
jgi:hypothetical protein